MSENIPTTSTSLHHKKSKRKYDKIKLPTPPPDPTVGKSDDRDDFLAYLDSLQKSSCSRSPPPPPPPTTTTSTIFAPAIATEDAFDHLEKLYKLMEQMLELREQNVRLHRRIRDLEHVHNLEKMYKQLDVSCVQGECPELDKDTAFAETILESILQETKSPSKKNRLRQSISRRRNRSGSIIETEFTHNIPQYRRASTCIDNRQSSTTKSSKVSKWTKVKAAFKWEKASSSVSDAKSQDSGIGGNNSVPVEVARYLRVPSMATSGDDASGHSPVDSGAGAEISSTPGTLSTASSNDDFHCRNELHSPCEDFKSSDDEHSHVCNISHSKDGSQKSNKSHHKTPWAKMKDIIQTRNSLKKKHRLSAQSDDIQIDIELCSDNEDVFDDNDQRTNSDEVPPDIVARYQQAVAEDGNIAEKKTSKWTRVKKAFLAPNETVQSAPPSPQPKDNQMRYEVDDKNTIEAEIQKNYKQLQKKLSIEFQEKLSEWERMKQTSPNTTNPSSSSCMPDENRDPVFAKKMEEWQKIKSQPSFKRSIPMTSEENLPPEFRKKLQEWERIRKNSHKETTTTAAVTSRKKLADVPKWKSLSTHRNDNSPTIEYPVITEEFRKKLNEWKQIKASGGVSSDDNDKRKELKTSPGLSRKNSSTKICKKHEKDMHWFEKELSKIEKEKQRLERERQKFLEREERLSKLRNSVIGSNKKEILIHTPSGFHRFEGISRKFAQKLYEWEKAQGIGPESSTFALLHSSLVQDTNINPRPSNPTFSLIRSKSADSIAISALNLTCPLMSQPSSLSLNNVDDLEKECLVDSKSSSQETLNEPEALIVEVEDIVEETAAPLRTFRDKTQQPVYQREELKAMCEGETCIAPKVRRSESTKAQNNYYLIEEIFNILAVLTENELEIQKTQDSLIDTAENLRNDPNFMKLQGFDEAQRNFSVCLSDKIKKLQEANSNVLSNLTKDNPPENFIDISETIQDLSTEILQLTERLNREISNRNIYESFQEAGARSLTPILGAIKDLRSKILEMRRRLSYICAASDLTAPGKKISQKKSTKKIISDETSKENEIAKIGSEKNRFYIKSENSNVQSQGAIKKRIRYRQKTLQNRNALDTDDEEENMEMKRSTHKKLTRTRSISEGSADKILENSNKPPNNQIIVDQALIQKIVVPTKTNYVTVSETTNTPSVDTPVSIFVKTTRKIFTPIAESSAAINKDEKHTECAVKIEEPETNGEDETVEKQIEDRLPPLPASPPVQRKTKDISPSIRLMLAKYNQKLEESSCKSGASSGSISPAWRSPKSERRVKAQTEKYQKDLNQLSPNFSVRREVQKSASVGFLQNINTNETIDCSNQNNQLLEPNLIKSTSTSIISNKKTNLKLELNETDMPRHSPEIRLKKLQKAKEEFLNSTPQSAPPQITNEQQPIEFPTRNRLSQISVGSDSSHDSSTFNGSSTLMKSASAGMINIDATAYRQINPEIHGGGYVSLPRQTNKQQKGGLFVNGKFAFSQIASKFRKVKMRKGKDKMNVVPILCRQSLVVDINQEDEQQQQEAQQDLRGNSQRSNDDSNNSKSTSSWLKKRTKLFKK